METACPYCRTPLMLPRGGSFACQRCRRAFRYYPVVPVPAPVIPCALVQSAGEVSCALHSRNRAAGNCERCGDFMCPLCAVEIEGRSYCTRCFDLLYQRGAFRMARQPFTLPGNAVALALLSLPAMVLYGLGYATAIASILMAVSALRQIGARPDLPGRTAALAAIAIAVIVMLLATAYVLLILFIGKVAS
jgi:hypothetical protein